MPSRRLKCDDEWLPGGVPGSKGFTGWEKTQRLKTAAHEEKHKFLGKGRLNRLLKNSKTTRNRPQRLNRLRKNGVVARGAYKM